MLIKGCKVCVELVSRVFGSRISPFVGILYGFSVFFSPTLPESASHSHVACSASRCDVRGRQPLWKRGLGVAAPRCPSADKSMVVEILATGQLYEWSCRSAAGLGLESSQRHWLYNSSRLPIVAICLWFLLGVLSSRASRV